LVHFFESKILLSERIYESTHNIYEQHQDHELEQKEQECDELELDLFTLLLQNNTKIGPKGRGAKRRVLRIKLVVANVTFGYILAVCSLLKHVICQ